MLCVLQKVKIIDDRLILIKLSKKPLFSISKQYFSGSMRAFIRIYIQRKKLKHHIKIIRLLLKLDTSGAIDFFYRVFGPFSTYFWWILTQKYCWNTLKTSFLQVTRRVLSNWIRNPAKKFVRISNSRHIRFLLNGKKVDLYIPAILR